MGIFVPGPRPGCAPTSNCIRPTHPTLPNALSWLILTPPTHPAGAGELLAKNGGREGKGGEWEFLLIELINTKFPFHIYLKILTPYSRFSRFD